MYVGANVGEAVGAVLQLVVHGPGKYSMDEADGPVQVLAQAGWVYRAVKMCIRMFQWERAYELARTQAFCFGTEAQVKLEHCEVLKC